MNSILLRNYSALNSILRRAEDIQLILLAHAKFYQQNVFSYRHVKLPRTPRSHLGLESNNCIITLPLPKRHRMILCWCSEENIVLIQWWQWKAASSFSFSSNNPKCFIAILTTFQNWCFSALGTLRYMDLNS